MYTRLPLISILAVALTTLAPVRPVLGAQIPELNVGFDNYKSVNPPKGPVDVGHSGVVSQMEAREWTNAKRLANHMPLKPPHRKVQQRQLNLGFGVGNANNPLSGNSRENDGTPTVLNNNPPAPSTVPPGGHGCLEIRDSISNVLLGFVDRNLNSQGSYTITPLIINCLDVKLPTSIPAGSSFNFETTNGQDASLPFLGTVVGYRTNGNDIQSGPAYGSLTSVVQTPAGSPAVSGSNAFTKATGVAKNIESNVWRINTGTGLVSLNWVNSDRSVNTLTVGLNDNTLVTVANPQAFVLTYGPTTFVTLRYLPL